MWGFIAWLVEYCTGITEVVGSNLVEARFFQASSFQLLKLENLQPQFKYELLFHIKLIISLHGKI